MTASTSTSPFTDLAPAPRADAEAVAACLCGRGRVGIAYSGGVDSAVLLAVAVRALGADQAVGLLAVSASLPDRERRSAHRTAAQIGAQVVEFATHENQRAAYRANAADRCFHCKDELFTVIDTQLVDRWELAAIAYGENADDAGRADRPGSGAAADHAVLRPLAEARLTKDRVRNLARALGLAAADKPAAPCLASRIPHGEVVTPETLRQVERAEDALLALGFDDCRVRHHGETARIEVPTEDLVRFADVATRQAALEQVRRAGFRYVTLDLAGLQSGAFTLQVVRARG
ncbi:MAG: ATP-dependent sacrificial sulfur transferase LarE [Propioniciclava sp.]